MNGNDSPTVIAAALRRGCRFLLVSHARPDGDALGSLLGLRLILRALDKHADVLLREPLPYPYGFLPGAAAVVTGARAPAGDWDAVVLIECSSFARPHIAGLDRLPSINIDHHRSAPAFASLNWIDAQACAAAEMIYRLAHALGVRVTPAIATCLYTGILADTGGFVFANTSAASLRLAAALARLGADPHVIAAKMYLSYPQAKMRMLAVALGHLTVEAPLAWMWVSEAEMSALQARWEDAEGLVNYALAMEGIEAAIFFRPAQEGGQRVSLRSKGALDVAAIAAEFGGGGHAQASGFRQAGALQSVMDRVLGRMREALAAGRSSPSSPGASGRGAGV